MEIYEKGVQITIPNFINIYSISFKSPICAISETFFTSNIG